MAALPSVKKFLLHGYCDVYDTEKKIIFSFLALGWFVEYVYVGFVIESVRANW